MNKSPNSKNFSGIRLKNFNSDMREQIINALKDIKETDIGESLVNLGLLEVNEQEGKYKITVAVHNPALHARKKLEDQIATALKTLPQPIDYKIDVVALPPETQRPSHLRTVLRSVTHVVAIASGKGGVGKSTVTANLAVALNRKGYKTAIVDADIYGPSIPMMFGVQDAKPKVKEQDGKQLMEPVRSHDVDLLSIGFFADMTQPVAWRGPMAVKALKQMFFDTRWNDIDVMLVDLPPGTGDIHLSLVADIPLAGVVVVSTPQDVALADASRGIAMFRLPSVNVPVLGMVENMAYFTPEELPDNKYYIFGKGGARGLAEKERVPFLGEVPLVQGIREAGDSGKPAALKQSGPAAGSFDEIASRLLDVLKKRSQAPK